MENWLFLARHMLAAAWRRRWLLVATAWAVSIAGWIGVSLVPDTFESKARLYVDADAILTPLLKGIAIDTATANQLEVVQRTLLSRPNLDKLIAVTSLNLSVTSPQQREKLIANLGREIMLSAEAKNLFTLTYRDGNPQLAHDIVAGLVNIFMEQANGSNRADMQNAQNFLNQQIGYYEVQLRAAEHRRAEFRRKYLDILPLESNGGLSRLDSARIAVRDLEAQLKDAISKRQALQEESRVTSPMLSAGSIRRPGDPTSAHDQLAIAEAKVAELRARFTDQHPDVISARQLVASLKAAPKPTTVVSASGPGNGPALPNPVYEQVKVRLIEADGTISSLQNRLESARHDMARMEELAQAAPRVQAEYEDLDRGYNVLRKNYEDLLGRRESSKITAAADTGADKVRLRIIDPPQVPTLPAGPNRLMLLSVALLAGLGASMALAVLISQADRSISDTTRLRELGLPILGGISMVPSSMHRAKSYPQALTVAVSILFLLAVYGSLAGRMFMHQKVLL